MGGRHRRGPGAEAPVQRHGGGSQPLPHGGAGAVQPKKWDILPAHGEGGGDTLIEQITRVDIIQNRRGLTGLFQRGLQRLLLHGAFRLLPAFFSKGVIGSNYVEERGQRPFALLFTHNAGIARDYRRIGKGHGLAALFLIFHDGSLPSHTN
ncbi:hypothetical protein SDC9_159386 [bioreactor metagenome]|uniref:Uncharacterized protein n=1 Tax=bioreactor metagenome TaxID=1076179 RepID=A0A645FEQ1_9ZZZZ